MMKKLTEFTIVIFLFCLAISCTEKGPQNDGKTCGGSPLGCMLRNESGHTVSIVHKPACKQLPDSLVLSNGEKFTFDRDGGDYGDIGLFYGALHSMTRIIYYDGRYTLNLDDLTQDRDFSYRGAYTIENTPEYLWSFTFTEEDYRYAVEHGTDIGKK